MLYCFVSESAIPQDVPFETDLGGCFYNSRCSGGIKNTTWISQTPDFWAEVCTGAKATSMGGRAWAVGGGNCAIAMSAMSPTLLPNLRSHKWMDLYYLYLYIIYYIDSYSGGKGVGRRTTKSAVCGCLFGRMPCLRWRNSRLNTLNASVKRWLMLKQNTSKPVVEMPRRISFQESWGLTFVPTSSTRR